jgi:predicted ATPase
MGNFIRSIKLANWKSFEDATLTLESMTLLLGLNASGKSNLLDALHFLSQCADSRDLASMVEGTDGLQGIRGGQDYCFRKGKSQFSLTVEVANSEKPDGFYAYSIAVGKTEKGSLTLLDESLTLTEGGREKRLYFTEQYQSGGVSAQVSIYKGKKGGGRQKKECSLSMPIISQIQYFNLENNEVATGVKLLAGVFSKISLLDPAPSAMRSYSRLDQELAANGSNLSGVLAAIKRSDPNGFEALKNRLLHYAKQLPEREIESLSVELVGKFATDGMLYVKHAGVEDEVDARGVSDGTLRFLFLLVALLTCQTGSTLVIEEIDNGIHPSRAKLLLAMVKEIREERDVAVVVTSHNPAIVANVPPAEYNTIQIVFRDRESGYSKISCLSELAQLPRLMGKGGVHTALVDGSLFEALYDPNPEYSNG